MAVGIAVGYLNAESEQIENLPHVVVGDDLLLLVDFRQVGQ